MGNTEEGVSMDEKEARRERRKLRRAIVRKAMEWSLNTADGEKDLMYACEALNKHEATHPTQDGGDE